MNRALLHASTLAGPRHEDRSGKQCFCSSPTLVIWQHGRQRVAQPFTDAMKTRSKRPVEQPGRVWAQTDDIETSEPSKGLFDFVTNNPSSKSAIQLENLPSQDSDVGRITARIREKGMEFGDHWSISATGSCARVDELTWFIREVNESKSTADRPPILLLHGVPSQSYSFLPVMVELGNRGYHVIAPDWIGFGNSPKPQPGQGFNYTEEEFHKGLDLVLQDKGVRLPLHLVAHGFITGQYAVSWALANPDSVAKLVILDVPLSPEVNLPTQLLPLRLPLVGEFAAQNAILAERTLEGGTPYEMAIDDAEMYRRPYLTSSTAGVALLATVRAVDMKQLGSRLQRGLSEAAGWTVPTLILTGDSDKYIKAEYGQQVAKSNSSIVTAHAVEASGHQPQEDYPQLVVQFLTAFFK